MSMGKLERDRQPAMWVTTTDLPTAASHPFYRRLNQLLREHDFDDFVEAQCASFYAATTGRPGLPPGIYFRLLLIGYFEGIDSERCHADRDCDRRRRHRRLRLQGSPAHFLSHAAWPWSECDCKVCGDAAAAVAPAQGSLSKNR
jgi:hypothetical protein